MFNQLFFRSDALIRQLSAPLVDERRQYLAECASQGMSRKSLRAKSLILGHSFHAENHGLHGRTLKRFQEKIPNAPLTTGN